MMNIHSRRTAKGENQLRKEWENKLRAEGLGENLPPDRARRALGEFADAEVMKAIEREIYFYLVQREDYCGSHSVEAHRIVQEFHLPSETEHFVESWMEILKTDIQEADRTIQRLKNRFDGRVLLREVAGQHPGIPMDVLGILMDRFASGGRRGGSLSAAAK